MKSLYINTTGQKLSLAFKDGENFANFLSDGTKSQSEEIFSAIEKILNGVKITELDFVVVISGPGSFTGIRLGLSIAKGIKLASNIPVIAIDNFKASLYSFNQKIDKDVNIIISAGGNDVFVCKLDKNAKKIASPFIAKENEIEINSQAIKDIEINPLRVLEVIEEQFSNQTLQIQEIEPTYVKPHYAKVKKS